MLFMNDVTDRGSRDREIALSIAQAFTRPGDAADIRCRVVGHHHDRMSDDPSRAACASAAGWRGRRARSSLVAPQRTTAVSAAAGAIRLRGVLGQEDGGCSN